MLLKMQLREYHTLDKAENIIIFVSTNLLESFSESSLVVLLITSFPLISQKSAFKDASVCLFIFDCLQFNDENVMKK